MSMVVTFDRTKTEIEACEQLKEEKLKRWIPTGLEGTVVDSLEELQQIFPEEADIGAAELKGEEHYDIYTRDSKGIEISVVYRVAHGGCLECKKITVGPPKMKVYGSTAAMDNRRGLKFLCGNCDAYLCTNLTSVF